MAKIQSPLSRLDDSEYKVHFGINLLQIFHNFEAEEDLEMAVKEKKLSALETDQNDAQQRRLILFNDEVNTFDFVIESLIEICKHDPLQAENCALIAHFKGKCPVKNGSLESLKPYYTSLSNRQLTVEIN